jgi:leucyl-tRNA synthetase
VILPSDASEETITAAVLASEAVQNYLKGEKPKKVIIVNRKLVNLVI